MSAELPPSSPLKRALDRYVPFLYRPLRAAVQAVAAYRFRRHYARLTNKVIQARGRNVMSGPFRGMHYLDIARSSALLPKLLGTYEDELHATLEKLLARPYKNVVDIGSAEGYYAVGLATRLTAAKVLAYDIDPIALRKCEELAQLNGVTSQIEFRSQFEAEHMRRLQGKVLVVCDVDGFETELFAPGMEPCWKNADLVIELHDFMGRPCRAIVERCLAPTHRLEIIQSQEKSGDKLADFDFLTPDERRLAVSELRPPQAWLIAYAEPQRPGPQHD